LFPVNVGFTGTFKWLRVIPEPLGSTKAVWKYVTIIDSLQEKADNKTGFLDRDQAVLSGLM